MPLGLHTDAQNRLRSALVAALESVQVDHNKFVHTRTLRGLESLDEILPGSPSKIRRALAEYVGEAALSDFVSDQLISEVLERPYDDNAPRQSLSRLNGFEDVTEHADRLVDRFESLPWDYELYGRVPYDVAGLLRAVICDTPLELSPDLSLVILDDVSEYPGRTSDPDRYSSDFVPKGLVAGDMYVRMHARGYIGRFIASAPFEIFQRTLRSLYGMMLAFGIVRTGASSSAVPRKSFALPYRRANGAWALEEPLALEHRLGDTLWHLGVSEVLVKREESVRVHFAREEIRSVQAVFGDQEGSKRIRLAAQWLFDSYAGGDGLLSYVQATIVLEILFGDKAVSDVIGLGELLANRCAYTIGKTRKQRSDLVAKFRRIYETRSKIVHAGKDHLVKSEEADLSTLQWMAARAIQEESRLVLAERE